MNLSLAHSSSDFEMEKLLILFFLSLPISFFIWPNGRKMSYVMKRGLNWWLGGSKTRWSILVSTKFWGVQVDGGNLAEAIIDILGVDQVFMQAKSVWKVNFPTQLKSKFRLYFDKLFLKKFVFYFVFSSSSFFGSSMLLLWLRWLSERNCLTGELLKLHNEGKMIRVFLCKKAFFCVF